MNTDVYIHARLTAQEAERLAASIELGTRSRPWLAGQIIRQWLDHPNRQIVLPAVPGLPKGCTAGQAATAKHRKSILDGWIRILTARAGRSIREATDRYLRDLTGRGEEAVSERTLYYWRIRYEAAGLAGLIDRRSCRSTVSVER